MATIGVITNTGLEKSREAQNNEGWKILPTGFGVSAIAGALDSSRSTPNTQFFTGNISSAIQLGSNTVQVTCEIPANSTAQQEFIREIYLFAKDVNNDDFLLAIGQPTNNTIYNPDSGSVKLRLQLKLANANDIASLIEFQYTQATEISEHNQDVNAHPLITSAISKAGLFTQVSQHTFKGQYFDQFAQFDGSVDERDVVYKDEFGVYQRALANNTGKDGYAFAQVADGCTVGSGFYRYPNGFPVQTKLYLSETNPGKLTDKKTANFVGTVVDATTIFVHFDDQAHIDSGYDAVVSLSDGIKHFDNFADAIAATPEGGKIAVRDVIALRGNDPVDTQGKQISFVFEGIDTGVTRFAGQNEIQKIDFSDAADFGEFILEYAGEKTARIPNSATPAQVQTALLALSGINNITVTGDFTQGFTVEFVGGEANTPKDQITVADFEGTDERQRILFSSDDFQAGSFQLEFRGQNTASIAFNEVNQTRIATELLALPTIDSIIVSQDGSATTGTLAFFVDFQGEADGKKPQDEITVPNNTLADGSNPINITVSEEVAGVLPDNNLSLASEPVAVSVSTTQEGEQPGPTTAFRASTEGMKWVGLGKIDGFQTGIDLNSQLLSRIEMCFASNPVAVDYTGITLNDFNADGSLGFRPNVDLSEETAFRSLVQAQANAIPDKSVIVTASELTLSDGSKHGLVIGRSPADFAGGSINFETGVVTGGDDFVPYTPSTANRYFHYGVMLTPGGQIQVLLPPGDGTTPETAPKPVTRNGLLRNIITLQDNGSGGFSNITDANITRYFDTGVFARVEAKEEVIVSGGGISQIVLQDITFDPNHDVLDLEVLINGKKKIQSETGDLNSQFRKVGNNTIEFSDGAGNVLTLRDRAQVVVYYKGDLIDDLAADFNTTNLLTDEFSGDGSTDIFTATSFQFSDSNQVEDIEVLVNREQYFLNQDFVKISATEIQFNNPPRDRAVVRIRSRQFSAVGRSKATVELRSDGVASEKNLAVLDFSDDFAIDPQGSGNRLVRLANPAAISGAVTTGTGVPIFGGVNGGQLDLKSIIGINGVVVTSDGDTVFIGLAQSQFFRTYQNSPANGATEIPTGLPFDSGSRRLIPFKNGLAMHPSLTRQPFSQVYAEGTNEILLSGVAPASTTSDFAFYNTSVGHVWSAIIPSQTNAVIDLPFQYQTGSDRLLVFRNGQLMNRSNLGLPSEHYAETNNQRITLATAPTASTVIYVIYLGASPKWREDFDSVVGNTLTFSDTFDDGAKILLFRRGVLMFDTSDTDFVTATQRYVASGNNQATLEQGSVLSDNWSAICL